MRTYLVIIDETAEASIALRFAARRANRTGGAVQLLALVPTQPFSAFGAVQATIEEEARQHAEDLLASAAGNVLSEGANVPKISVIVGDGVKVVRDYLAQHPEVSALVLGAACEGGPGPLVTHFSGLGAGQLPCPLYIIPGSLNEADIDRLS
jgi:hypothetical protein